MRDWRQVARFCAFLLIIFSVSLFFVPGEYQLVYWRDVLPLSLTLAAKDWCYNQSLFGFLARFFRDAIIVQVFYFLLASVILVATWWRSRIVPRRRTLAAVSCLYLLVHPVALQHYFGLAIIPLVLLWDRKDWFILVICYLLLAFDIKNFEKIPKEFSLFLSHDFYAVLGLWILALWREKFSRIVGALLAIIVVSVYIINLLCRAKYCF